MTHGAYILGCAGTALTPDEAAFFKEARPWGFILFQRNIETPEQTRALTDALRASVGWDAPVLIDQEGGRVQRMWPPTWRAYPPALDQGPLGARAMYLRSRLIAEELRTIGIDTNCAPLCDIARADTHPFLRNRCYADSVAGVIDLARAVVAGQGDGGVLSVMKHMPGHGRSQLDTHKALPVVTESAQTLRDTDFAPFKALAGAVGMGMTAHLIFEAFDPDLPATTSQVMHGVLRDEIGFGGLLMTDDLSMEALSGSVADRSRASLDAGCDVILHCNGILTEMEAVATEAGKLSALAQTRAEAALARRQTPDDVDMAALAAEFDALLASQGASQAR
ncbi:MAG: glycoside hydrolase family 3 N-terminal domain-containing protein [Pseudomonadota bacterium]